MKKLFTTIAVAFIALTASAQFDFGLKGGLNVTNMSLSTDVLNSSNRTGFYIGPTVKFVAPLIGIGFDAAVLYDQREGKVSETSMKQQQIAVPVNLRYQIGLGDLASLLIYAGPQLGVNFGDKITNTAWDWKWQTTNLSVNVGAGVMLANHLQINANYNIACGKTGEFSLANTLQQGLGNGKMNSWQVGLAYYF